MRRALILLAFVAACSEPQNTRMVKPSSPTDSNDATAAVLCAPFGGLREIWSRDTTVSATEVSTRIFLYCNDGSSVSRTVRRFKT